MIKVAVPLPPTVMVCMCLDQLTRETGLKIRRVEHDRPNMMMIEFLDEREFFTFKLKYRNPAMYFVEYFNENKDRIWKERTSELARLYL